MASELAEAVATEAPSGVRPAARALLTPTRVLVVGAVLVAAALLVLLVVRLGHSNDERDRALDWERHSYEVMLATRSAESSMASAEASLGRYAISADRAMGASYYDAWVLAGAQIDRLAAEVGRDRAEAALVGKLQALYRIRSQELGVPAIEAARHRGWGALNAFNAAGHSDRIAEIKQTLEALRTYERKKLAGRLDRSEATSITSANLAALLSVTGLALVVAAAGMAWAVTIGIAHRRQAEAETEEAENRADWLHDAVDARTAELSEANRRLQDEIAERTAAESQLRQMQKMDAVGRLTGGIAHDFNNMLAVIVGEIDLARRRTRGVELRAHLDRAMDGADRAAALTRRLLGFARAEPLRPEAVRPEVLIAGMSDLITRALGERITVVTELAEDGWAVWADPLQLENALLNLAVNGRDAMEGAGTLTISTGKATLADGEAALLPAGDYARMSVRDTGAGMTPEVLERVFEPFFTTKPVGKGTGLGMSQIFGFVRESGGDVTIDTAPGRGTTVTLLLPRTTVEPASIPAPAPRPAEVVPIAAPAAARATPQPVLVVEDDPRVRAATVGALEELGYGPIACESAEDGLIAFAEHPELQLVITDVVMPGMTGPEFAQQVRAVRPEIELLFVSGYSGEDAGELAGETLIRKPFTIAQLDAAVAGGFARAALSAPHPPSGAAAAA